MDGATPKGVKTRPSYHDMILPEVLPGNDWSLVKEIIIRITGSSYICIICEDK
jgi:hypothetical protein